MEAGKTSLSISSSVIPAVARITDRKRIRALRDHDKGQRKEDRHIAGKHQKAEMPDETDVRKLSSGKRRRPVGDKR